MSSGPQSATRSFVLRLYVGRETSVCSAPWRAATTMRAAISTSSWTWNPTAACSTSAGCCSIWRQCSTHKWMLSPNEVSARASETGYFKRQCPCEGRSGAACRMFLKRSSGLRSIRCAEPACAKLKRGISFAHESADRSEEHTSELQSRRDLPSFPTRRSSDLQDVLEAVERIEKYTVRGARLCETEERN